MKKETNKIIPKLKHRVPKIVRKCYCQIFTLIDHAYYYLYNHKNDDCDAILISFPKSGRTWLRFILAQYYHQAYGEKLSLNLNRPMNSDAPKIKITHNLTILKYHPNTKYIILLRNPKDIIVSYFHHISERDRKFKGNISSFIKSKKYGFASLLRYFDKLEHMMDNNPKSIQIYYEDLKSNDRKELERICNFLNLKLIPEVANIACEQSRFERMRKIEDNNLLNDVRLSKRNNSRKVRKGKVGNYKQEVCPYDIEYMNRLLDMCENKLLQRYKHENN